MKALIRRTRRKDAIVYHPFVNKFTKYHVPLRTRKDEIISRLAYKDMYIYDMFDNKSKPSRPTWTTVSINSEIYETADILNKIYKFATFYKIGSKARVQINSTRKDNYGWN